MKIQFQLNRKIQNVDVDSEMPLLWVIRDVLNYKGTKFGCGRALCGACTVHIEGEAVRSCSIPVKDIEGKKIITIEGLSESDELHPVQQAWLEEQVPQCGYCQTGFMMASAALLEAIPNPTDQDINDNITNICRCGTYYRMRKAIHKAATLKQARS